MTRQNEADTKISNMYPRWQYYGARAESDLECDLRAGGAQWNMIAVYYLASTALL